MAKPQRRWSTLEDAILKEAVEAQLAAGDGKANDWNRISKKIPGRSNKDCRKRYYNGVTEGLKKGSWTEEEDRQLQEIVGQYGQAWAVVASHIKTRSADQCAKRWAHILDPSLDRSNWRVEEVSLLISAVKTHGTAWKDIQQLHFPNRAANSIKNQHTLIRRKTPELPTTVLACCPQSPEKFEDQGTIAEPSWSSQQHDLPNALRASDSPYSSDFGVANLSHISDSSVESESQPLPSPGSNETCVNFDLFPQFERRLGSSRAHTSLKLSPNNFKSVGPQAPYSENLDCAQMVNADGNSGELNNFDMTFAANIAVPNLPNLEYDPTFMDVKTPDLSTTAIKSLRAKIELEDVEPATVSFIMSILIHSKAKVKFETNEQEA